MSDKDILAAGAVLWRETERGVEVAVAHRPHYDDWSLPKGKLDPGETLQHTAVREVLEETGFHAVLGPYLTTAHYAVGDRQKTVEYYSARAVDGVFTPNAEVDALRWCTPDEANELFSYSFDGEVLARFLALPRDGATILLVRHAKAGDRDEWSGDDDERPLCDAGLRQAEALRGWLALFGPSQVHAAPRVRCVDTVSGLAKDLSVAIVEEPLLSEEGYWVDRSAGRERLLELADGVVAVCSQGGVIPDVVRELSLGTALESATEGKVPSKKGSVWVLGFSSDGKLSSADYYRTALATP